MRGDDGAGVWRQAGVVDVGDFGIEEASSSTMRFQIIETPAHNTARSAASAEAQQAINGFRSAT
jgi:hypothetical protein